MSRPGARRLNTSVRFKKFYHKIPVMTPGIRYDLRDDPVRPKIVVAAQGEFCYPISKIANRTSVIPEPNDRPEVRDHLLDRSDLDPRTSKAQRYACRVMQLIREDGCDGWRTISMKVACTKRLVWLAVLSIGTAVFLTVGAGCSEAPDTTWNAYNKAGQAAYKAGDYAEAAEEFRKAVELAQASENQDLRLATSLNNLAEVYRVQGDLSKAEPLFKEALEVREAKLGDDSEEVALSLNNLAAVYQAQGRYEAALPLFKKSLAVMERVHGKDHPQVGIALNNLAGIYRATGNFEAAEPLFKRSLVIWELAFGVEHQYVAAALTNLAELYYTQGRYAEAEPLFQRALAINERILGPTHLAVASGLTNLAAVQYARGNFAQAEPLLKRALEIKEQRLGVDHPQVATSLREYADLLRKLDRPEEAAIVEARVKNMQPPSLPEQPSSSQGPKEG